MKISQAELSDIPAIMAVISSAKKIMRSNGNMQQWTDNYPNEDVIAADINSGYGFLCHDDNGNTTAYFAAIPSPDPTYKIIYNGQWLDDTKPYIVVHRIASTPSSHGTFNEIVNFCRRKIDNIRIDTHCDNKIMQHCLNKYGFSYCGIILLANGNERMAYQILFS